MTQYIMLENRHIPGVNPIVCGMETCAPEYSFGPAIRGYYLLHYVVSGSGTLHNDRGDHSILPGQIFVIHPGETTTYTAALHNPWHYIWVGFETSLPNQGILVPDVLDGLGCGGIFEQMVSCGTTPECEYYICGKVYELLYTLRQKDEPLDGGQRYVRVAQDFIRANYMHEITVEGMASNLGLDRSYFSRLFKKHTNRSPQEYLLEFRTAKAAELLLRGIPCTQVAMQTGYHDLVQFSRMFRKRYGISPSRYRCAAGKEQ